MERITQQHATAHPIPAISEAPHRSVSDTDPGTSAQDWLSPAMAIWIQDDDTSTRTARQERAPSKTAS